MNKSTIWVCCGVLTAEINELLRIGKISGELLFMDSMLHMAPMDLEKNLISIIEQQITDGGKIVLVYGDCCPCMLNIVSRYNVGRVNAINCAQMLVGRQRYRELMKEESFMILPEWALRWEEVFRIELGLTKDIAHDLMRENRGSMVYLDTGLSPVPFEILAKCSEYIGLPLRIENISLDSLLMLLLDAESAETEKS